MSKRRYLYHIRDMKAGWQEDPAFVYIGAANRRYKVGSSLWNIPPIKPGETRDAYMDRMEATFLKTLHASERIRKALRRLYGKKLVCWCCPNKGEVLRCHGEYLKREAHKLVRRDREKLLEERQRQREELRRAEEIAQAEFLYIPTERERQERIEGEISILCQKAHENAFMVANDKERQVWKETYWKPILKKHQTK